MIVVNQGRSAIYWPWFCFGKVGSDADTHETPNTRGLGARIKKRRRQFPEQIKLEEGE